MRHLKSVILLGKFAPQHPKKSAMDTEFVRLIVNGRDETAIFWAIFGQIWQGVATEKIILMFLSV